MNKFVLEDDVKETPAGGGGEKTSPKTPSSDVDWMKESDPDHDDSPGTLSGHEEADEIPGQVAKPTPPSPPPPSVPPAPSAPEAPSAPATPTAATPPGAPATPVAPAPTEAVAPPVAEPVAPALPTAPDIAALRAAEVSRLTGVYTSRIPEEVARGLLVEPERHLPAILANLQVDTIDAVVQHIYASLPQVIQNLTRQSTMAQEAESTFFRAWPQLAERPEYKPVVENAIRGYRQLNPKATRDEIVRAAGLQAMITLRLPLPAELFSAPPPAPTAPAPSFQHAAPAASTPTPSAPGPSNPYVLLNEEFDREERG